MSKYQQEASVTESPQFHGELIRLRTLETTIASCIVQLRKLDRIKKTIFYGKGGDSVRPFKEQDCSIVPAMFQHRDGTPVANPVRIIHGIIGVATEAGEMLEMLNAVISKLQSFDEVNLAEESGDVLWYIACNLNSIDRTFEEVEALNIAKLRKRYPNKFTEFDAINRDVGAERNILEGMKEVSGFDPTKPTVTRDGVTTSLEVTGDGSGEALPLIRVIRDDETEENAGKFLERLGLDADVWAREFIKVVQTGWDYDLDFTRAWFANAIEAGRTEGYWRGRRETNTPSTFNAAMLAGFLSAELPQLKDMHPEDIMKAVQKGIDAVSKSLYDEGKADGRAEFDSGPREQ